MADSDHSGALPAHHSPEFDAALNDLDLFARLITLPRHSIEIIVEAAIAHLDTLDGDPDMEPSCGDLDHLADDDRLDLPVPVSRRIH